MIDILSVVLSSLEQAVSSEQEATGSWGCCQAAEQASKLTERKPALVLYWAFYISEADQCANIQIYCKRLQGNITGIWRNKTGNSC